MPEDLPPSNLQALTDRLLLQELTPPAVLVNERGDILYINGRTGRYLEPAAGKANWNIHVMARDGLRAPLDEAMRQAMGHKGAVELTAVPVQGDGQSPLAHARRRHRHPGKVPAQQRFQSHVSQTFSTVRCAVSRSTPSIGGNMPKTPIRSGCSQAVMPITLTATSLSGTAVCLRRC